MTASHVMNSSTAHEAEDVSPERIGQLADGVADTVENSISEIKDVNVQSQLLSFNARIEAARAGGTAGAAFGIVAQAMSDLSHRTSDIASRMAKDTERSIGDLARVNQVLSTQARGVRLSDLALVNIDLVDRNLYERSCDVRWWATDGSLVDALARGTPESIRYASDRMGIILNSYTVYFDLVLCDLQGKVVANGRPGKFASQGTNHATDAWFRTAIETRSGEEFGFHTVHESSLVDGQRVLVYSCCVRADGQATGKPLGVLGIIFNWDALAQAILCNVPLSASEIARCRACFTDENGLILADSWNRQLVDRIDFRERQDLYRDKKNFQIVQYAGKRCCIGHARSPGFETYATGWHSVLIFSLDGNF